MHSHSLLTRDKLLRTRQLANNILCIPRSRLPATSTHMTSSLSSLCLIMVRLISTVWGRKTKREFIRVAKQWRLKKPLYPASRAPEFIFFELSKGEEVNVRNRWWPVFFFQMFLACFFFFFPHLYLMQRFPNWVSAAWVVVVSMATTGPTQHKHWGRHLTMLFIPHQSQKWCWTDNSFSFALAATPIQL